MKSKAALDKMRSFSLKLVNILPVIFWLCLIYSFDGVMGANISVIAMVIHESGHILCSYIFTGELNLPHGDIVGLKLKNHEMMSYKYDIAMYSAGALFNIIAAVPALGFQDSTFKTLFILINLATALSNLLPIDGYDGYRIATCLLSYFNTGKWAYNILEGFSFTLVFLMSIAALFLVYTYGNGYWIMGIFIFALLSKLKKWKMETER